MAHTEVAQGRGRQPWRQRVELIGALVLAALDAGVYLVATLAARPSRCSAPQVTTPVLDCFWDNLGASLFHLAWVFVAVSLAVPCAVGLLLAKRGGTIERGAMAGGVAGLCGSGCEALLIAGIMTYEFITAAMVPGAPACPPGSRCVTPRAPLTSIPGVVELLLVIVGTIVVGVVLFRLLSGMTAGALGAWLGRHLPRARQALTHPAYP